MGKKWYWDDDSGRWEPHDEGIREERSWQRKQWYSQSLRDPRWDTKRKKIMARDNWTCLRCGRNGLKLNVHHTTYHSGYEPWHYEDNELQTLCEPCHKRGVPENLFVHLTYEQALAPRLSDLRPWSVRVFDDHPAIADVLQFRILRSLLCVPSQANRVVAFSNIEPVVFDKEADAIYRCICISPVYAEGLVEDELFHPCESGMLKAIEKCRRSIVSKGKDTEEKVILDLKQWIDKIQLIRHHVSVILKP